AVAALFKPQAYHTGDTDQAFEHLRQSRETDFATLDRMEKSSHLVPLREDARWEELRKPIRTHEEPN
ncbi:MAG: hypothetical protein SVT56_12765, partial [Chloroflexota bacterium]|nr:hypothetical protein [Chloroflexota bacterium]